MEQDVEKELDRQDKRIMKLEDCQDKLLENIGALNGKADSTLNLIKFVIFPLLVIVGSLVGVKLIWPGT